MLFSEVAVAFIKDAEGFRSQAYQDQVGVWTLGYGSTQVAGRQVQQGDSIEDVQAEFELREILRTLSATLTNALTRPVSQSQFDALLSLAYNVGVQDVLTSTLLKKLNLGDVHGAAEEFPRWDHAGGAVDPGLLSRRLREKSLFLS